MPGKNKMALITAAPLPTTILMNADWIFYPKRLLTLIPDGYSEISFSKFALISDLVFHLENMDLLNSGQSTKDIPIPAIPFFNLR